MALIFLSFAVGLLSALFVIHMARTSPEGFEDETGFHFVRTKRAVNSTQPPRQAEANLATITQHPIAIRS